MESAQGPVSTELEQEHAAPDFGAHTPLSEKLLAVAIRAQNFTGSSGIAIALTEGQEMICRANWGTSAPEVGTRLSIEHSFTGLCVRTGEPLRCDDAQSDPRVDAEACRALGISAIAAAPVRRGLKVVGVIAAFSDTPNAFTDKHLLILTTLSEVIVELVEDPVQPLPQIVAGVPDLARATAIAKAPVTRPADETLATTVLRKLPQAEAAPAFTSTASNVSEPPVEAEPSARVAERPTKVQPPRSESLSTVTSSTSASAGTAASSRIFGHAAPQDSAARGRAEILPAAMDPGSRPQQPKTSTRIVSIKPVQKPTAELSATDTPTFAALGESTSIRRWFLPAVMVAIVVIVGVVGWRLHAVRKASMAKQAPSSVEQPQVSAAQPEVTPQTKTPEAAPAEPQHSPFSPPPITAVTTPARTKPISAPAADVTVRRSAQPVVETTRQVRRPAAIGISSAAQVPEAQAPQLALSAPDLPIVLAKPAPVAVAAPVSRVVMAKLVHRVEPAYPEAARRLRLSGKVVVRATITKAGTIGNVRWLSGNELFRDATLTALKQWRYTPASLNNQLIESDLDIVLNFNRPANQ